jgi:hypothetical protein
MNKVIIGLAFEVQVCKHEGDLLKILIVLLYISPIPNSLVKLVESFFPVIINIGSNNWRTAAIKQAKYSAHSK